MSPRNNVLLHFSTALSKQPQTPKKMPISSKNVRWCILRFSLFTKYPLEDTFWIAILNLPRFSKDFAEETIGQHFFSESKVLSLEFSKSKSIFCTKSWLRQTQQRRWLRILNLSSLNRFKPIVLKDTQEIIKAKMKEEIQEFNDGIAKISEALMAAEARIKVHFLTIHSITLSSRIKRKGFNVKNLLKNSKDLFFFLWGRCTFCQLKLRI